MHRLLCLTNKPIFLTIDYLYNVCRVIEQMNETVQVYGLKGMKGAQISTSLLFDDAY